MTIRLLVLAMGAALALVAASPAAPRAAAACPAVDELPQVSPNGNFILLTRRSACRLRRAVWIADGRGRLLRRLVAPTAKLGRLSWRSDGLASVTVGAATTLFAADGRVRGTVPIASPFWAPDARHAAYGDPAGKWLSRILFWPEEVALDGTNNAIASPQPWSPGSDRFAYIHLGNPTSQVVVVRRDRTASTTLYTARVVDGPAWSPDGTSVAFAAGAEALALYVSRADSDDDLGRLTPAFERMGHPSWSPDGRWIAFAAQRGGRAGIWAIRPNALGLHRIASNPLGPDDELSWYPNSSGVAYEGRTHACARIGVFVARVDAGASQRLTNRCGA